MMRRHSGLWVSEGDEPLSPGVRAALGLHGDCEPVFTPRGPLWVPRGSWDKRTDSKTIVPLSRAVKAALSARAYLWTPQKGIRRIQHNLGAATATPGTAVTTGAASSTKGAHTTLISPSAFECYWITIIASNYGLAATTSQGCLDILTGAVTADLVIPNLLMGFCGGSAVLGNGPKRWDFPLYIPGNTIISAASAGDRVSTAVRVIVVIYGGDGEAAFEVGGQVETFGITTVPAGTDVASGYSGAGGSWVEITADSGAQDYFAAVPSFHPTDGDTTLNANTVQMDMGIGAATEELLLGREQSFIFKYSTGELCEGPWNSMPVFAPIPANSRLVARLSHSAATNTGEPDCAIHCVR